MAKKACVSSTGNGVVGENLFSLIDIVTVIMGT